MEVNLQNIPNDWIVPDWSVPSNVKALFTTRQGGCSRGSDNQFASLNLATHVNDDVVHVEQNRALLRRLVPGEPKWLQQVHGVSPVWVDEKTTSEIEADAAISKQRGIVCAVMVADCLPVFCAIEQAQSWLLHMRDGVAWLEGSSRKQWLRWV